jgi:hypothetical protein
MCRMVREPTISSTLHIHEETQCLIPKLSSRKIWRRRNQYLCQYYGFLIMLFKNVLSFNCNISHFHLQWHFNGCDLILMSVNSLMKIMIVCLWCRKLVHTFLFLFPANYKQLFILQDDLYYVWQRFNCANFSRKYILIPILPWHIATRPRQRDSDLGFECWRLDNYEYFNDVSNSEMFY